MGEITDQMKITRLEKSVQVLGELLLAQLQISQNLALALLSENKEYREAIFIVYREAMDVMRERMTVGLDRMMMEVEHD